MADPKQVYRARPTPDEIAEVLAKRLVATVGTLNEDGSIHLAYVIFLHHDGRMYFETSSVTRKARNAERRGWASMIVQGRASTGRSLMVAGEGTARVLRGHALFDDSAVTAVKQWRYQPLLLNGQPTEFILTVTVLFNLRPSAP